MPFTKFTNLDFDQIKTSIKDYLRANSTFSDFDFEGSNFSILIDTLAYNTYITAFNSNMIVNESFLDSATLRENVVSLAKNIGYVPRSRTAAKAIISFSVITTESVSTLTLKRGLVCVGEANDTTYTFSIPEDVTANVVDGVAQFNEIEIYQGTYLTKSFTYDGSLDQRFILNNPFIDTSTLRVYVKKTAEDGLGIEYSIVDNILNITPVSKIYLIQEVQDEKYEIIFGDGIIGKKLGDEVGSDGTIVTANYIITDGRDGNGPSEFSFAGSIVKVVNSVETVIDPGDVTVTTVQQAINGSDIESINSIKYYAPRVYSSQNRAVTSRDYEAIIKQIYPNTESVAVIGGEELDPPEFGNVILSIKPKNGTYVSDFDKTRILSDLKQYTISGINQKIIDLKVLYVEIDSSIYYNNSQISGENSLKTKVVNSLTKYSESLDLNKFGGRFKYSKVLGVIDKTDTSITSNITKVRIRRDLRASLNQFAQYELCFGNRFHINPTGRNIKSTGFTISGESSTVYLTDTPSITGESGNNITSSTEAVNLFLTRPSRVSAKTGVISVIKIDSSGKSTVVVKDAGTVDYVKGEIMLGTVNITSTEKPNGVIEIQAFPESNDVIGLKDLYLSFDISKSQINMRRDVIASGDEITGNVFTRDYYTSSYSNGNLTRN